MQCEPFHDHEWHVLSRDDIQRNEGRNWWQCWFCEDSEWHALGSLYKLMEVAPERGHYIDALETIQKPQGNTNVTILGAHLNNTPKRHITSCGYAQRFVSTVIRWDTCVSAMFINRSFRHGSWNSEAPV